MTLGSRFRGTLIAADAQHRRLHARRKLVGECAAIRRKRSFMKSFSFAQLFALAIEVYFPNLLLFRVALVGRKIDYLVRSIHVVHVACFKIALRQLPRKLSSARKRI